MGFGVGPRMERILMYYLEHLSMVIRSGANTEPCSRNTEGSLRGIEVVNAVIY